MLTNSQKFRAAHIVTRSILRSGDSYRATFGLALKMISGWVADIVDAFDMELSCKPGRWIDGAIRIWNERRIYINIRGQNRFGGGAVFFDLVNVKVCGEGGMGGSKVAKAIDCFMTAAMDATLPHCTRRRCPVPSPAKPRFTSPPATIAGSPGCCFTCWSGPCARCGG